MSKALRKFMRNEHSCNDLYACSVDAWHMCILDGFENPGEMHNEKVTFIGCPKLEIVKVMTQVQM